MQCNGYDNAYQSENSFIEHVSEIDEGCYCTNEATHKICNKTFFLLPICLK